MKQLVTSPKALGSALQRQRKAKGLNQKEAGQPFSIEQSTVSTIKQGTPGTRLNTLFRLMASLDLEMIIQSKPKLNDIGNEE